MTKEITSESLVQICYASGISLPSSVAVEIFTGEPGGHSFLQPELIGSLVRELKGTIAECNTAYEGKRNTSKDHWGAVWDHGSTTVTSCDILDEKDHMPPPITGSFHLTENYVDSHLQSYDSILMLSHFRNHVMGGLDGALKNMFIDLTFSYGKIRIHPSGTSTRFEGVLTADHDSPLKSMADADRPVMDYMDRENMVYINVANRLSVDCGCGAHPYDPEMRDIGIFASTDPAALDQACVDAVYTSEDGEKVAPIE